MPLNWPPVGNVVPPFSASDWDALLSLAEELIEAGWTHRAPTGGENASIFNDARCDLGHIVTGRVLVSPGGQAYYFAACNTNHHEQVGQKSRAILLPWPPFYYNGWNW